MMPLPRTAVLLALSLLVLWGQAIAGGAYAGMSDEELMEQAAQVADLTEDERRALLTEIRTRRASSQGEALVVRSSQRRYGRSVRQADGTATVRIERREKIVRFHSSAAEADEQSAFGVGFERRVAELEAAAPDEAPERGDAESVNPQEPAVPPPVLPATRADTGRP